MVTYNIKLEKDANGDPILQLSFADPAQNDQIVRDAKKILEGMKLGGGRLIKLNGAASLPVIVTIVHHVMHSFAYMGIYDPKLNKYVIAVAHGPEYRVGDLID